MATTIRQIVQALASVQDSVLDAGLVVPEVAGHPYLRLRLLRSPAHCWIG